MIFIFFSPIFAFQLCFPACLIQDTYLSNNLQNISYTKFRERPWLESAIFELSKLLPSKKKYVSIKT